MSNKQQLVTIKGKKDGLILQMDDQCSYKDLIHELKQKISSRNKVYSDGPLISVKVVTGNRYLTEPQQEEIQELIRAEKSLFVAEIESNVITKEESEALLKNHQLTPLIKMIRSGQVLEVTGDLLLIGDVNSGAKVIATGNIYILGVLRGVAHAGFGGFRDKIIAASVMKPSQLIIGDIMNRSPEEEPESSFDPNSGDHLMESAFVDPDTELIVVDRISTLFKRSTVEN